MKIYTHFSAGSVVLEDAPFKSEASMEGYILDNPVVLKRYDSDEVEIKDSQVSWKGKKNGKNGRLDVLAIYNGNTNAIVELKLGVLEYKDFSQLNDYFKGDSYLQNASKLNLKSDKWVGVLVGADIDEEFEEKVSKLKIQGKIPFYVVLLKRYFNKEKDQYFVLSNLIKGKSATRYSFNERVFSHCNQLVFALIKEYVCKNPSVSRDIIAGIFNKYGFSDGKKVAVVKDLNDTDSLDMSSGYYFSKPEEQVIIQGFPCLVKSFWYRADMDRIIKLAKDEMGFDIIPV